MFAVLASLLVTTIALAARSLAARLGEPAELAYSEREFRDAYVRRALGQ